MARGGKVKGGINQYFLLFSTIPSKFFKGSPALLLAKNILCGCTTIFGTD
jgi:hypothetical protein